MKKAMPESPKDGAMAVESLKQVWVLTAKFSLWPVPAHLLLALYQRVVQLHSWADAGMRVERVGRGRAAHRAWELEAGK